MNEQPWGPNPYNNGYPQQPMQPQQMPPQMVQQASSIQPIPKKTNNLIWIIIAGLGGLVLIGGIIMAVVLANVRGKELEIDLPGSSVIDEGDDEGEEEDAATGNIPAGMTVKEVNETIMDVDMGYTVKVKRVLFSVPLDNPPAGLARTGFAVEFEASNNGDFASVATRYLEGVIDGDSTIYDSGEHFNNFVAKNDFVMLPDYVEDDETVTGWKFYAYYRDLSAEKIDLVYDRPSGKEVFSGKVIPAKKVTVRLK